MNRIIHKMEDDKFKTDVIYDGMESATEYTTDVIYKLLSEKYDIKNVYSN